MDQFRFCPVTMAWRFLTCRIRQNKQVEFTTNVVVEAEGPKEETQRLGRRATMVNKMRNITARGKEWAGELKDKGRHLTGLSNFHLILSFQIMFTNCMSRRQQRLGWKTLFSRCKDQRRRIGSRSGRSAFHICRRDERRWNSHRSQVRRKAVFLTIFAYELPFRYYRQPADTNGATKENRTMEALQGFQGSTKLWIGKDYTNFIVKDFVKLDQPLQGNVSFSFICYVIHFTFRVSSHRFCR